MISNLYQKIYSIVDKICPFFTTKSIYMISLRLENKTSLYFVIFFITQFGILCVIETLLIKFICLSFVFTTFIYFIYPQKWLGILKNGWIKIKNYILLNKDTTKITNKPSGLENTANTCYMNSTIQMLASSDKLIGQFENTYKNISTSNTTLEILIGLLHSLNKSDSTSEENTRKRDDLIDKINWKKVSQQDAIDLLSSIINSIQKESKKELSVGENPVVLKSKMLHQYSGINIPKKIQDHLGLSLGLYGNYGDYPGVTIKDLIENHFLPCYIDEDENKKSLVFFYKNAPDVLLLHIQANKWDSMRGEMIKPTYHIQYEQNLQLILDIATDLDEIQKSRVDYKLCAIVHHMGTISGGHYIAYRKYQNKWYLVNDEDIREVEFNYDVCPYILLYEKKDYIEIDL